MSQRPSCRVSRACPGRHVHRVLAPAGRLSLWRPQRRRVGSRPSPTQSGRDPRLERCGRGALQFLNHPAPTGWRCLGRGVELAREGLVVLGPLGSAAFVRQHLQEKRRQHNTLLQRIPAITDLHSAWLLLLFCASPPANYLLRMLPPDSTTEYAREHDQAVAACLSTLLYGNAVSPLPAAAASAAHLPVGGLGLRSAAAAAPAAYWASWQDSFPALLACLPTEAEQLLASLNLPYAGMPPVLAAACSAAATVGQAGFPTRLWGESSAAPAPHLAQAAEETLRGWQLAAASGCDERAVKTHLCQLDGTQVARNVRVGDMSIDVPVSDARRIGVVANGLPLWHGAQLAIDATIVSPVTRTGSVRHGADTRPAAAVQDADRRRRRQTYPDPGRQTGAARRTRDGGWRALQHLKLPASFLRLLAQHRAASVAAPLRAAARAGCLRRG